MKAAIYTQYGSPEVLKIKEVKKPVPNKDEILIKIHATAVNSGDCRLRKADPFAVRFIFGLLKPSVQVLGSVYSGEVELIGENVKKYKSGDKVYGHTDMKFGAHAEYLCVSQFSSIQKTPTELTDSEAASIPFGGLTALHFIQKANVKVGQKVLIIGASGAVGSAALQLSKAKGAIVTGVCSSKNSALIQSLGANAVVDYTKENIYALHEQFDVVFDTIGVFSVRRGKKLIKKNGVLILSAAGIKQMREGMFLGLLNKINVISGVCKHSEKNLSFLNGLIQNKQLKPVIDRTFQLDEIAMAHAYVDTGHKVGSVVIII